MLGLSLPVPVLLSQSLFVLVSWNLLNYFRYDTVLIFYFTAVSFKVNGFKTSIMICDGASANLSMIKASHGCHSMYGVSPGKDPYRIKPWFVNPFDTSSHIYWLICPHHQVNKYNLFIIIKFTF